MAADFFPFLFLEPFGLKEGKSLKIDQKSEIKSLVHESGFAIFVKRPVDLDQFAARVWILKGGRG